MLYPVGEVAIQLGVSERTVYRLMDSGELVSVYVIDSRRVEHDQLIAYIARQRQAAHQRGAEPDEGGAGTGPGGGAGTGPRPPYPPKPGKARP
jgi:excisionase family DNA binding protein